MWVSTRVRSQLLCLAVAHRFLFSAITLSSESLLSGWINWEIGFTSDH
jgi:hypothetical protein